MKSDSLQKKEGIRNGVRVKRRKGAQGEKGRKWGGHLKQEGRESRGWSKRPQLRRGNPGGGSGKSSAEKSLCADRRERDQSSFIKKTLGRERKAEGGKGALGTTGKIGGQDRTAKGVTHLQIGE